MGNLGIEVNHSLKLLHLESNTKVTHRTGSPSTSDHSLFSSLAGKAHLPGEFYELTWENNVQNTKTLTGLHFRMKDSKCTPKYRQYKLKILTRICTHKRAFIHWKTHQDILTPNSYFQNFNVRHTSHFPFCPPWQKDMLWINESSVTLHPDHLRWEYCSKAARAWYSPKHFILKNKHILNMACLSCQG